MNVASCPPPRVLVLTTDLPFFPGKTGDDFFRIRDVAARHEVGIVSMCFDTYPPEGVANLERVVDASYLWPRALRHVEPLVSHQYTGDSPTWLRWVPTFARRRWLRRLLGIAAAPRDALDKVVMLAHCAPYLLQALADRRWDVLLLVQSSLEPWMDYLPSAFAKLVYFHDVRADYLRRSTPLVGPRDERELRAVARQEQRILDAADAAAFVSELDLSRAQKLFRIRGECGIAPIPIDLEYFHPAPGDWNAESRPSVLFTGHLSHPPNVDAIVHFIDRIWPRIRVAVPGVLLRIAGRTADPRVVQAVTRAPDCELHENVPDIRPFFWNAKAYIVPMRFGGGVRQKLFEAWAMGVPVVCTPMAAEGTQAVDGVHCFMASGEASFAERVLDVLNGRVPVDRVLSMAKDAALCQSIEHTGPPFEQLVRRAPLVRRRRPFKVLYDLRWMETGRAGGIEQATYELVSAIGALDQRNEYRLLAPRSACWDWSFPAGFRVQRHCSDAPEQLIESHRSSVVNALARSVGVVPPCTREMRSLAAYRKLDFDIVHSLASYTNADMRAFPSVVTISDLQHLEYPQFFRKDEWEERERLYRASAESAGRVICISEFTRQDVHRRYGISLDKLVTVWNIPSRSVWRRLTADHRGKLLERMGVQGRFLFFPAHCWPHKNHARLVQAFEMARGSLPTDVSIVMTGRPFAENHEALGLIRDHDLGHRVRHLGYRSPLEVLALYQSCHAVVFPSLFEGFGMPVAEAIIAERPVACSNVTSLPEIAGDAALMFDPKNISQIADALVRVSTDEILRGRLVDASRKRRTLFSSRRAAARTIAVYGELFAGRHVTELQ